MAAKISLITAAVLAALAAGGTPSPLYSLDFTSTLPSQVTFTRSGSRMAVVAGSLTTVGANTAAIESTSAGVLGLSIEPASTNNLLQSNTFNTTWTLPSAGATLTSGQPSPDGGSNGWDVAETTINNYHEVRQDLSSVGSGVVMCTSVYIKAKSGAVTNGIGVHNCNQFSNAGALTVGFVDESAASFSYDVGGIGGSATTFNNVSGGSQKLANGWTRVWSTGTSTASGTKTIRLRSRLYNASGLGDVFAGTTTNGFELAFAQTEYGVSRPTSYKATTTGTVSTSADSAIITDLTWLTTAQGTLLVEHDCTSGVLLGSGTNTVLSGAAIPANRITAKTALAWSGTTSDLVSNGGATTTGAQPTFGADVRLLATSATTGLGHIKSLKYYPTRLTVTQIQALTAPTSTAPAAGTYRVAAQRAVLNNGLQVISGTTPSMAVYWPTTIGSGDRTKVRVSFGNWVLNDTNGDQNPGNTTTIVSATLVHIPTGQYAPIYWGGLRTVTATNGQVKINSDDILPSAFPALTAGGVFPNAEQFAIKWGRLYGGSITVALIDGQDPRTPLRPEAVGPGKFKGLLTLDRWMVDPSLEDLCTEYGPDLGLPNYYRVGDNAPALRGQVVHRSRVMFRLVGVELPYQQRLTENLWGISVLERLYDRMIAFDSATTGAAQLVFKAHLRTLKIEGLREIVAAGGDLMNGLLQYAEVMRRFQGIEGITLLDLTDEFEVQGSGTAITGVEKILGQLAQQLSGALQIPLVRLFGQSPGGLGSNGDHEMATYHEGIDQKQNKELRTGMTMAYRLLAQSEGIKPPDDFAIDFRPLDELDDTQKAATAKSTGETVGKAMEDGIIGRQTALKELRNSSKRTGVFSNITAEMIESADDEVMPPLAETAMQQEHEAGLLDKTHEHQADMTDKGHEHANELADKGAQTALSLAKAKGSQDDKPGAKKKTADAAPRRRVVVTWG